MPRYRASMTIEYDFEFLADDLEEAEELITDEDFLWDIASGDLEGYDDVYCVATDLEELS